MKNLVIILLLLLGACASSGDEQKGAVTSEDDDENIFLATIYDTVDGAVDTIQSPFRDLGVVEEDIPDELEELASNPYEPPESAKCEEIFTELSDLDLILGQDKYAPRKASLAGESEKKKSGYWAEGSKMASNMAVGKLGSKVNIIPLRGVVRRLSGADAHEKAVRKSYQAGQLRRAYLRGMADAKGMKCKESMIAKAPVKKDERKNIASLKELF